MVVCKYWQRGCCNRYPCPFLHGGDNKWVREAKASNSNSNSNSNSRKTEKKEMVWRRTEEKEKEKERCLCKYFLHGHCKYGADRCRYLHAWSWSTGAHDFSLLTPLHGHSKPITAILQPSGSDKLLSSSEDGTVNFWDCHTGQCILTLNFGTEITCIMTDGPSSLFVGTRDSVKVYNTENNTLLSLSGPAGLVYGLAAHDNKLFAGTQTGEILVWRFNPGTSSFYPYACLTGHRQAVRSLVIGGDVWAKKDKGGMEVIYTHTEEHGVLALCETSDATGQSVLSCSVNDQTVRLYNLPSFLERGRIFAKKEVQALQTGPGGLFFTGDGTGDLKVWKW
ncbi:hypothetical protein LUZ61_005544 [Rhynchospora tenuis]|uniref:C3H1-type domain-containing protein n=1 Tax=Rhynchospora tenuis TaxID=198213 RepID=A0AAD5ZPT0_9POAL|nr:hypothetical protein LUZ61_005544 [Rhynchospora tenuis]